jgi:small subunit ribosomal protein S3e
MESGAKGCEVVVSGKLRAARAKSMKFTVSISQRLYTFVQSLAPEMSLKERENDLLNMSCTAMTLRTNLFFLFPSLVQQDGFMIHSGQPARDFIDSATRHVLLRQGVLGIKVKIMRSSDPEGKSGPQKSLPDSVTIIEPKEEQPVLQPTSQDYGAKAAAAQQLAEQQRLAEQQEAEAQDGVVEYEEE